MSDLIFKIGMTIAGVGIAMVFIGFIIAGGYLVSTFWTGK